MSLRTTMLLLIAAGSLLPFAGEATAEPTRLTHNPFSRPPSASTTNSADVVSRRNTPQVLDLRATMVAKNNRLADVAGRILRPGDEVNGYELLQVFEDRAVFDSDGKRLTIYVKPELAKNDETK